MSERDDYLHDPSRPRDPEIEALEKALAPLRWRDAPLRERPLDGAPPGEAPTGQGPQREAPVAPRRWPWLAAAAALLVAALGWWWSRGDEPELRPGASKRTFASASAASTIRLGELVEITLKPDSELTFVHWKPEQALFALARGGLVARVAPPPAVAPAFFVVETPLGRVIDRGCRYELDLLPDGSARVRVTEGMVSFVFGGREVFVPAGASTIVDAGGPHTPLFDDATPLLQKAVRVYDEMLAKGGNFDVRAEPLKHLLANARTPRDALPVWHVLFDPDETMRQTAERHLIDLVGVPYDAKFDSYDPATWLAHLRLLAAWRQNMK